MSLVRPNSNGTQANDKLKCVGHFARRLDMAIVKIPAQDKTLMNEADIRGHLESIGIGYERWEPAHAVADDASPEEILAAYAPEIERLKTRGGYVTADVIDVNPETPG